MLIWIQSALRIKLHINLLDVLHKTFSEELINKLFKEKLKFIKYNDIFI